MVIITDVLDDHFTQTGYYLHLNMYSITFKDRAELNSSITLGLYTDIVKNDNDIISEKD